jgi:hypothetical protein
MSWFARTIANSLKLDEEEKEQTLNNNDPNLKSSQSQSPQSDSQSESPSPSASTNSPTARGVKEDISELTKSLSRQFWGVASFLAPPPDPDPQTRDSQTPDSDPNLADEDVIAGIRSDFAEISGKFKSGISKLSGHKTVSEFTKIASSFLQIGSEEEYDLNGVVGVTEEVVSFARNLAMHPETWLDFPLPDDPDSDGIFFFHTHPICVNYTIYLFNLNFNAKNVHVFLVSFAYVWYHCVCQNQSDSVILRKLYGVAFGNSRWITVILAYPR